MSDNSKNTDSGQSQSGESQSHQSQSGQSQTGHQNEGRGSEGLGGQTQGTSGYQGWARSNSELEGRSGQFIPVNTADGSTIKKGSDRPFQDVKAHGNDLGNQKSADEK